MKLLIGFIVIFFCHYLLGVIYNSSFFEKLDISYGIECIILILIGIPNGILATRLNNKINYIKWVIFSTIPGLLFMTYARTQDSSSGLMPTSWDWGLWELFLPAIYFIVQVIFLIYFLSTRNSNANNSDNKLKT